MLLLALPRGIYRILTIWLGDVLWPSTPKQFSGREFFSIMRDRLSVRSDAYISMHWLTSAWQIPRNPASAAAVAMNNGLQPVYGEPSLGAVRGLLERLFQEHKRLHTRTSPPQSSLASS
jgi:uncharacterized membrane protein YccC